MTRGKYQWIGYAYVLPIFLFLILFVYFGIVYNVYISLFEWDGIGEKTFIGLQNYLEMFRDPKVYEALLHTFQFMAISVPCSMLLGFIFALLLHSIRRFADAIKAVIFLPYVMAIIVIGITFQMIYEPNYGLLNEALRSVHLDGLARQWIGSRNLALASIAAVYVYSHAGFYMLLYYTSILNINAEVFEAAEMDGAGALTKITRIVAPLLKSTHIILLILGVIATLKVFELVWIMTGGGPGGATELLSTFVFRSALLQFEQGYSAAISVLMLMIALVYTIFQLKSYDKARR